MAWASEKESLDYFRQTTIPVNEGISIIETIEQARAAQQASEQAHDVQLEINVYAYPEPCEDCGARIGQACIEGCPRIT